MVTVRAATGADRDWLVAAARELLGDEAQVHSRRRFTVRDGEALVASLDGAPVGFATWDGDGATAEILMLGSLVRRRGVGRALVAAVVRRAAAVGIRRVVVVTTDDNVGAQRFYEGVGFGLAERRIGAVDECRRRFKPSIPLDAHDELEYAMPVTGTPSPEEA